MTAANCFRMSGGSGAIQRAGREQAGEEGRGWQDKGPRCAARIGCGFSMGYAMQSRCAQHPRSLRSSLFSSEINDFVRCAGLAS